MPYLLAQLSLDNWNPLTTTLSICIAVWTISQAVIGIIRAKRGDNTPTPLDGQISKLFDVFQEHTQAMVDLQQQQTQTLANLQQQVSVPPAAPSIADLVKAQVNAYLSALKQQQQPPPQPPLSTAPPLRQPQLAVPPSPPAPRPLQPAAPVATLTT